MKFKEEGAANISFRLPFLSRDASFGTCTYNLSLLDVLSGLHKVTPDVAGRFVLSNKKIQLEQEILVTKVSQSCAIVNAIKMYFIMLVK